MSNDQKKIIDFKAYMPGEYGDMCRECDWGTATVTADSINDAISKGLRPHDAYHSEGSQNCGGDRLVIYCPDGTVVET